MLALCNQSHGTGTCLSCFGYNKNCDIWSLGVVLCVLFTGSSPYQQFLPVWEILVAASKRFADFQTRAKIAKVPAGVVHMILRCLSVEPAHRPSALELFIFMGDPNKWDHWGKEKKIIEKTDDSVANSRRSTEFKTKKLKSNAKMDVGKTSNSCKTVTPRTSIRLVGHKRSTVSGVLRSLPLVSEHMSNGRHKNNHVAKALFRTTCAVTKQHSYVDKNSEEEILQSFTNKSVSNSSTTPTM